LIDPAKIEKIGEIEKASRLAKGIPIYEIAGYPERDIVAVKEDNNNSSDMLVNVTGFSIYVWNEGNGKPLHYPEIPDSKVHQIQVYKGTKLIRELERDDVQTFLELMKQLGPHNEFHYDQFPQYTVLYLTDDALGYNYGIIEKNGEFGLPHNESKLPVAIAQFFKDENIE
jgi:hypothetical protein